MKKKENWKRMGKKEGNISEEKKEGIRRDKEGRDRGKGRTIRTYVVCHLYKREMMITDFHKTLCFLLPFIFSMLLFLNRNYFTHININFKILFTTVLRGQLHGLEAVLLSVSCI